MTYKQKVLEMIPTATCQRGHMKVGREPKVLGFYIHHTDDNRYYIVFATQANRAWKKAYDRIMKNKSDFYQWMPQQEIIPQEVKEFTLEITTMVEDDEEYIRVKVLKAERFDQHGFGTFLSNVNPKEVSVTKDAMGILMAGRYRNGLMGMEFWEENRLAWGSLSNVFSIPTNCISVPTGSKSWIKEMAVQK